MANLHAARTVGPWLIVDSGVQSAAENMAIDERALDAMLRGLQKIPVVRFFQWDKPSITYGHLLDPAKVRLWAKENGGHAITQRPTGGGAVLHQPTDLSLSLLWPRKSGLLPDNPRDCYAAIHAALRAGVRAYLGEGVPELFAKDAACDTPAAAKERFSVCFDEPVCNDVMLGGRKIVGGALRVTRTALLYQGAVQLRRVVHTEKLKAALLASLTTLLKPAAANGKA